MANTGDAWAITQLLVNLPPSHLPFYWSSMQLHAILQRGGYLDNFPIQLFHSIKE